MIKGDKMLFSVDDGLLIATMQKGLCLMRRVVFYRTADRQMQTTQLEGRKLEASISFSTPGWLVLNVVVVLVWV
jgi:hypothetical protein